MYGDNSNGQCGMKNYSNQPKSTYIEDAIKHNGFNNVSLISNGMENCHVFVINDDKIYGFGRNNYAQIGYVSKYMNVYDPILIEYPFDSKLKQISCGQSHTLFLTFNGSIYCCGSNKYGQINHQRRNEASKYTIFKLPELNGFIKIGCGEYNSIALHKYGTLHTFGNNYFGELGMQTNWRHSFAIKSINSIKNIINFSVGSHHISCINKYGNVYMFGDNSSGQCGFNHPTKKIFNPRLLRVKFKDKYDIFYDIKCGSTHTIIKTNNNNYYSFGSNISYECLLELGGITLDDLNTSFTGDFNHLFKMMFKSNGIVDEPKKISHHFIKTQIKNKGSIVDLIPGYETTYIIQRFHE